MTSVRIFSRVDLPEPLTPISPTDSPGSTCSSRSRGTQRHFGPLALVVTSLMRSRSSRRVRSARNRFQSWCTSIEPSGDIGEPDLEPAEDLDGDVEEDDARQRGGSEQRPVRRVAVEHTLTVRVDAR